MIAENFGVNWLQIDLPFPCEIHQATLRSTPSADRFKVLLLSGEPQPLRLAREQVRLIANMFDVVITSDKSLLDLPNAFFFIFGDPWTNIPPQQKIFSLSYIFSPGNQSWDGYLLRDEIWRDRTRLIIENQFWFTNRKTPGRSKFNASDQCPEYPHTDKSPLFNSMFSLSIENVAEPDFFTEKILDAFQTYTIPMYYGCPNISDYFNPDGIIFINNKEDFFEKANTLSVEQYWSKLLPMAENKIKAQAYFDHKTRIRNLIFDLSTRQRERYSF